MTTKPMNPKHLAVQWREGKCVLLDQTKIPAEETYLEFTDFRKLAKAITDLVVRGAPAIGVAGAFACVLAIEEFGDDVAGLKKALEQIEAARPTAVNLSWAVNQMRGLVERSPKEELLEASLALAKKIHETDIGWNREMARLGSVLLTEGKPVLTYCNTGDLATGGIGTAFGVLRAAFEQGRIPHVYACETRPVLQGIRLTAWELASNAIPFTMICDNMAATTIAQKGIGAIVFGSDRIAANGDAANKIGSFGLAILAKHFDLPLIVVAPSSTFDLSLPTGADIPIEERNSEEVLSVLGANRPKTAFPAFNPAFDVTPHELITAIVCERGVIERPNTERVRACLG